MKNYKNTSVLLLGTNLGDRTENIALATKNIEVFGLAITKNTQVLETEPLGFESDTKFLNQILCVEHDFSPMGLLNLLKEIEIKMGRIKKTNPTIKNYNSRIIDIDILFFNNIVFWSKDLSIYHPQIHTRDFVMELLKEIDLA